MLNLINSNFRILNPPPEGYAADAVLLGEKLDGREIVGETLQALTN